MGSGNGWLAVFSSVLGQLVIGSAGKLLVVMVSGR